MLGCYFTYEVIKIELKAQIGQILLEKAWNKTLIEGEPISPWSSFDSTPIFKLEIPKHKISQIVLNRNDGQTLAWGPGYHIESFHPIENKITAISSHRDSHGAYIKNLQIGDIIKLQDINENWYSFEIDEFIILNIKENLSLKNNRIILITCYPFDTVLINTPFRYIVSAKKI